MGKPYGCGLLRAVLQWLKSLSWSRLSHSHYTQIRLMSPEAGTLFACQESARHSHPEEQTWKYEKNPNPA